VEWYGSLAEMAHGLEKNSFASMEYSVPATVAAVVAIAVLFVFPVFGMFLAQGAARGLFAATYVLQAMATAESARRVGYRPWVGPLFPFAAAFLLYVVVRSMLVTLRTGGIRWRGTFYPLAELKRNRV
jgi:hypothetical protein